MKGKENISKIREYCDYLENHLDSVWWAWGVLQKQCKDMRFIYDDFVFESINQEVLYHDLSKFSKEEFIQYCIRFYPIYHSNIHTDFEEAWENHKKYNSHHWENWTNKEPDDPYWMECNCVHMIIDWMAMAKVRGGPAQEYYENHKDEIKLPEWAITFCYDIFNRIKKQN